MTRRSKKNPLIAYLSGEASTLQKQQVESWLKSDESNQELYDSLSRAWTNGDQEKVKELLPQNAPWESRLEEVEEYVPHDFAPNPFPKGYVMFGIRVAATLLFLTCIYFLFESKFDSVWERANPELLMAQSPMDQDLQLELPKAGQVFLRANSELSYPAHFGGFNRKIELKGEADFDIKANEQGHPLFIKVSESILEVESGRFRVSQTGSPSIVEVLVESGSINFKSGEDSTPLYLEAGHRVIYAYEDNSIYTEKLYTDISLLE